MNKPQWNIPSNIEALVADDDDVIWETSDWLPIQLTIMGGTEYDGRDIPLAWQIDFEPHGSEFKHANKKITHMGLDPDGYGWAKLINAIIKKYHPEIADELQFGDTEESTCVVWVESETTCQRLVDVVWTLIYDE